MSEHLQYSSEFIKSHSMNPSLKFFMDEYEKIPIHDRKILEIGTRRWGTKATHHKEILDPWTSYVMMDFLDGEDVDLVADAHDIPLPDNSVAAIWTSSTFEHYHSPWVASLEMLRVLKPGGLFFVQTHQNFPIHGYPDFYFLFSDSALKHLFRDANTLVTAYEYPATLTPHDRSIDWNHAAQNWLNVCIAGQK